MLTVLMGELHNNAVVDYYYYFLKYYFNILVNYAIQRPNKITDILY